MACPRSSSTGRPGCSSPRTTPSALAQAIVGLLDDRHTAIKLAEQARRRAIMEFSPDAMVEGTLVVYADALRAVSGDAGSTPEAGGE